MSTVQLQNLLGYLNGLSLSMSNRRWLAEHLVMPVETSEYFESDAFYQDIDQAEADIAAGKGIAVTDVHSLFCA